MLLPTTLIIRYHIEIKTYLLDRAAWWRRTLFQPRRRRFRDVLWDVVRVLCPNRWDRAGSCEWSNWTPTRPSRTWWNPARWRRDTCEWYVSPILRGSLWRRRWVLVPQRCPKSAIKILVKSGLVLIDVNFHMIIQDDIFSGLKNICFSKGGGQNNVMSI